MGIKAPIIKEGDDLVEIAVNKVLEATANLNGGYDINDRDIIGITESVVARSMGNYVSVDDVADETRRIFGDNPEILIFNPIYSRNRFSMILKGIARAAKKILFSVPMFDEVGNPLGVNPFTGVDIEKYYTEICKAENCEVEFDEHPGLMSFIAYNDYSNWLYCGLHDYNGWKTRRELQKDGKIFATLADFFADKCEYGLLGSNKATEEKLKLFPKKEPTTQMCLAIKEGIKKYTGKDVLVCVYGDGCFKDPVGGIWEFADPVTMPAFTDEDVFLSSPFELKLKAFADDKFAGLSGKELETAMKDEIRNKTNSEDNPMNRQGTTPRVYRDLIASLMDLTSGSGDKGTPFILIQHYFDNFATE